MSGIYPGNLHSLGNVEQLGAAKEWTVLAALAHLANRPEALGVLAASADREPAFRWMWVVANSGGPQHWQQVNANLADGIKVPANLRDAVRNFVLNPAPQQGTTHIGYQQPNAVSQDPRREAQARLLAKLNPRTDLARELARVVLEAEEGRYWPELCHAAFDVLGRSKSKDDRLAIFEYSKGSAARERLRPLNGLSTPYAEKEQDRLLAALKEALPVAGSFVPGGPGPEAYWQWARELSARLSVERLKELLREPWVESVNQHASLFGGDFVRRLGLEKLEVLLASDLSESVRRHLVSAVAEQMQLEEQAEFGRWSHANLEPEWSQPLRDRLSTYARPSRYGPRSPQGESALAALQDFALVCDDAKTSADYVACLEPGEAPGMAKKVLTSEPVPWRLGRIAGELLQRDAETFRPDVEAIAELYPEDNDQAVFLTGILDAEKDSGEEFDLAFFGPRVLRSPQSMAVLAEAGHSRIVASAALNSDDPKRNCLLVAEAAIEHLDDEALEYVMQDYAWSSLDSGLYRRYVDALRKRPHALFMETEAALASLSGPEAGIIPNDKLEALLQAALDTDADGLTKWVGDQAHERLEALFGTTSRAVHDLARNWAARMSPDEALVGLIVETDDSTVGSEREFANVRQALAQDLVAKAQDRVTDYGERGDALELAQKADPATAREAALPLCGSGPTTFRRRAARVLATTDPRPDNEEELDRLLETEGDAQARRDLLVAKLNFTSGSIGQAVRNLRELAGLDPEGGPDTDVLLPYEQWHDAFVVAVDTARRLVVSEPRAYINALIVLADLLVEQAVIARFDAEPDNGSAKKAQIEALRSNIRGRPDVGSLLERQRAQQVFPWFNEVIVLRRLRGAHPAPLGTTRPFSLTNQHVVEAEGLFSRIVEEWEISMQESYRGRAGDQT